MGDRGRANREEEARTKADAAWAEIARALDLNFAELPPRRRDRDEKATAHLEQWAERLEKVAAKVGGALPDALDLSKLSRADLEAHAADLGVENPQDYPNKAALIEAVEERLTAPDEYIYPDDDGSFGEPSGEWVDADSIPPQPPSEEAVEDEDA